MVRWATIAIAALTPAVAHAQACHGQTFADNFSQGFGQWVFGAHDSLSSGNGGFASYQSPTQNDTETSGPNGATLSVLPEPGPNGEQWQAGLISTKQYQTYGVFQATVNINPSIEQSGMSWSFWMLGQSGVSGSAQNWPIEYDGAEQYGSAFDSAVHSGFMSGDAMNAAANTMNGMSGQHTFTIDWEPDTTTFYIDGQQTRQVATPADAHVPMMMILGTAATNPVNQPWTSAPAPGASGSVNVLNVRAFDNMQDANACGAMLPVPQVAFSAVSFSSATAVESALQGNDPATPMPASLPTGAIPAVDCSSQDAPPGTITPGGGSFTDAAGNEYTIDTTANNVATINGKPVNNTSAGTKAMVLIDDHVYGQDAGTDQWFEMVPSPGGDTPQTWQPLAGLPASGQSPVSSARWTTPPAPVTAQGTEAFNAAVGTEQDSQSFIGQQKSVLCELQAGLGRLLAIQAARQQ